MTEHKHADLLRAIAEGKEIQFHNEWNKEWTFSNTKSILEAIKMDCLNPNWRIRPDMIQISDGEVAYGDKVWWQGDINPEYLVLDNKANDWNNAKLFPELYSIKEPEFEIVKVYKYLKKD